MEFWTEPQMASIHKMLNPRSIAIVGATPRMQYGGRFLAAALKAKDRVRVYAVNPRYDEIMGVKSYPSVTDLPEAPDVVGIVVPYDQVLDVLQESHRKGAGSAIVISAGFAERDVDERRDLQGELGEFARASGVSGFFGEGGSYGALPPEDHGTYSIEPRGRITFTYADGHVVTETIAVMLNDQDTPDANYGLLLGESAYFGPDSDV